MDIFLIVPVCALIGLLFAIYAYFTMKRRVKAMSSCRRFPVPSGSVQWCI